MTNQIINLLASSMPGQDLNIPNVNRVHMGGYKCIASNGVPPNAVSTVFIEVHCKHKCNSFEMIAFKIL